MSDTLLNAEYKISLKQEYDYLAPDGSEIRLLVTGSRANLSHCVLPAGAVSAAICHRTVEELWYILEGTGEVWRSRDQKKRIDQVMAGDSIRIPVGVSFQFKAFDSGPLKILLATMPPWPGAKEATPMNGHWQANLPE